VSRRDDRDDKGVDQTDTDLSTDDDVERVANSALSDDVVALVKVNLETAR